MKPEKKFTIFNFNIKRYPQLKSEGAYKLQVEINQFSLVDLMVLTNKVCCKGGERVDNVF